MVIQKATHHTRDLVATWKAHVTGSRESSAQFKEQPSPPELSGYRCAFGFADAGFETAFQQVAVESGTKRS